MMASSSALWASIGPWTIIVASIFSFSQSILKNAMVYFFYQTTQANKKDWFYRVFGLFWLWYLLYISKRKKQHCTLVWQMLLWCLLRNCEESAAKLQPCAAEIFESFKTNLFFSHKNYPNICTEHLWFFRLNSKIFEILRESNAKISFFLLLEKCK